ncbi:hypothetical protein AAG570_009162 [Ranatra chinensis]|uniref:7-dehydrocholesterol reductase n=1 Tax=Ranatra chinensis TaxID=642074 RepID=A0ABD0YTL6_9HEMI
MYNKLRYEIVPPLFLGFFTSSVQLFALFGSGEQISLTKVISNSLGNSFSWSLVAVFSTWAVIWLKIPSSQTSGPKTYYDYTPTYQNNGLLYYFSSLCAFILSILVWKDLHLSIYRNTPQILGTLNIIALFLCLLLYVKGKFYPDVAEEQHFPQLYLYYRGIDLHPKIWGIDIKQLTNCRIGLMGWQLLILSYFLAGVDLNGFSLAAFTNCFLQSMYLCLFYEWEGVYFHTLDITLDRAGYYLCWGCLVWVPCFYTYSSYYMVHHAPVLSSSTSAAILCIGVLCIVIKCRVDCEKMWFRESKNDKQFVLWGSPVKYITAKYKSSTGKERTSRLLLSGTWGVSRHLNYTFELLSALFWSLPALGTGITPFFYFIFLFILLIHRIYRDEEKCSKQYGEFWKEYCSKVRYRLVPYIY